MLKLESIRKEYRHADQTVEALKGLSVTFRKNEFVSILGPSGCGKTTLLNIIGGLDRYTSGEMSLDGRSTKEFTSKDWDVYRNHKVGFIFQSYNLIPHQTVLGNVELALTIAGLSKAERVTRAKAALDKVGLSDKYYKRPGFLSGGQCQRVAIARALVNDPDILLADEPTGALDTVTSTQIMDLVKEIAKDRLVLMVTHNPELAEKYSTRIVKLLDGELQNDSNPFTEDTKVKAKKEKTAHVAADTTAMVTASPETAKKRRAKMSFFTAFRLSLLNLFSKKRRSIMTCIAGSIGIIGVSCVLSISYGLQGYIDKMQNDMLSGNPVEITETAFDINSLFGGGNNIERAKFVKESGWVNVDSMVKRLYQRSQNMENMQIENAIDKNYIDYVKEMPAEYIAALMLDYGLDVSNSIYTTFTDGNASYPDGRETSLSAIRSIYSSVLGKTDFAEYSSMIGQVSQSFAQAPDTRNTKAVEYMLSQYSVLEGEVAKSKNEVMIVLGEDRKLADLVLAQLGYYTQEEFVTLINKVTKDTDDTVREKISYAELLGKEFTWQPNNNIFDASAIYDGSTVTPGLGKNIIYSPYDDGTFAEEGLTLKVVGILEPKKDLMYGMLDTGFYYTTALAEYIVERNHDSELVQILNKLDTGAFESSYYMGIHNGIIFDYSYTWEGTTYNGVRDIVGNTNQILTFIYTMMGAPADAVPSTLSLQQLGGNVEINGTEVFALPSRLALFNANFDQKTKMLKYLDAWNGDKDIVLGKGTADERTLTAEVREKIEYTDMLSLIISMIKSLLQIITIALVGFTSLALVVSCVMIGIITYVSVVERTKEIGVIRSLGGRKRDVSNLFIAETFILGFTAGTIGIVVTWIVSGILNLALRGLVGASIAVFPIHYAAIMLALSIGLNLISGVMPSQAAAKKDPAVALRTE